MSVDKSATDPKPVATPKPEEIAKTDKTDGELSEEALDGVTGGIIFVGGKNAEVS